MRNLLLIIFLIFVGQTLGSLVGLIKNQGGLSLNYFEVKDEVYD